MKQGNNEFRKPRSWSKRFRMAIDSFLKPEYISRVEAYLSKSVDLADLEERTKRLKYKGIL